MSIRQQIPAAKFLIVDDLEENLLALEGLLRRDGLELLRARSGQEALELLLKNNSEIALALIDVQMPGMDGFELAELMRGSELTKKIPIIFVTAGSSDKQRRFRGYEAGAVDFLTKPIEPQALISKAEIFLQLWLDRMEVLLQRDELESATLEIARLLDESRRTADALQEADHQKNLFLATLAHELRNPLAPIRSGFEVLKSPSASPQEIQKAREMTERQLNHMVRLVDDLLDIARVTSGKINLQLQQVNLFDVIRSAVDANQGNVKALGHSFDLRLPDQKILVNADPVRLAQIFGNLIINAAKYTAKGGQIAVIACTEGEKAVIRVSDNGVGIPKEMQPKIFDLFTQVGSTVERSQGGLGIGLALVKKLVALHAGEISVHSAGLGQGSTFQVSLPVVDNILDLPETQFPEPQYSEIRPIKILLVDDNNDSVDALAMLLNFDGHQTTVVYNGIDALKAVETFKPEVVFLDIGLPGMNGYQVAEEIRAKTNGNAPVLIAVSGWGAAEDREKSRSAGFSFHLTKPVDFANIENLLRELPQLY